MTRCDIKTSLECSCNPGECRAIHLGTFYRDRTTDTIQNTFPPHELAMIAVAMFAISFGIWGLM